jgi:hypothetical protein
MNINSSKLPPLHLLFCVGILVKILRLWHSLVGNVLYDCVICYKIQLISCNVELLYHIGLIGYVNIYLFRLVLIKEVWI